MAGRKDERSPESNTSSKKHIDTLILELLHHEDTSRPELTRRLRLKAMNRLETNSLEDTLQRLENQDQVRSYWKDDWKAGGGTTYYMITIAGQKTLRKKKEKGSLTKEVVENVVHGLGALM